MNAMENMINEEMVQDVIETVVETKPNGNMMKVILEGGAYAVAGVIIWEGGKYLFKKAKDVVEAKKNAKTLIVESDFEDMDAE